MCKNERLIQAQTNFELIADCQRLSQAADRDFFKTGAVKLTPSSGFVRSVMRLLQRGPAVVLQVLSYTFEYFRSFHTSQKRGVFKVCSYR
jgi:hypothetical protein